MDFWDQLDCAFCFLLQVNFACILSIFAIWIFLFTCSLLLMQRATNFTCNRIAISNELSPLSFSAKNAIKDEMGVLQEVAEETACSTYNFIEKSYFMNVYLYARGRFDMQVDNTRSIMTSRGDAFLPFMWPRSLSHWLWARSQPTDDRMINEEHREIPSTYEFLKSRWWYSGLQKR